MMQFPVIVVLLQSPCHPGTKHAVDLVEKEKLNVRVEENQSDQSDKYSASSGLTGDVMMQEN